MSPISKLVAKFEKLSDALSNRPAQPYPGQQAHQAQYTQHTQQFLTPQQGEQAYVDQQAYPAQQNSYEQAAQPGYPVQDARCQIPLASSASSIDIFKPVATGPPPGQIQSRGDHPAPRIGIVRNFPPPVIAFSYDSGTRLNKMARYQRTSSTRICS